MTPLKSHTPENLLRNTISYFSFFGFAPTFNEIFTFYPKKISKKQLKLILDRLVTQKKLICSQKTRQVMKKSLINKELEQHNSLNSIFLTFNFCPLTFPLYTLPQYQNLFDMTIQRKKNTWKKLTSIYRYIEVLKKILFIQFTGLTGSASMGNCKITDDVDLFVITSAHLLFISRFCAIILSHILNVRKGKNSVCLNLFFDESNMTVPRAKQTVYVAHEILQMKPVIDKNNTYGRFLKSNKWVYKFFPNSRPPHPDRPACRQGRSGGISVLKRFHNFTYAPLGITILLFLPFELLLKKIQLAIIRKNKTSLIITPTQLWLFRKDFEKKIQSNTLL